VKRVPWVALLALPALVAGWDCASSKSQVQSFTEGPLTIEVNADKGMIMLGLSEASGMERLVVPTIPFIVIEDGAGLRNLDGTPASKGVNETKPRTWQFNDTVLLTKTFQLTFRPKGGVGEVIHISVPNRYGPPVSDWYGRQAIQLWTGSLDLTLD
jgi:hypothetical protein